jgi:hypothetical protein
MSEKAPRDIVEHERSGEDEEIEFQVKWNLAGEE